VSATSSSVEAIANAVLYEGYMLYPYRASSVKNRVRWNFGVVYPQRYSEAQGNIDCFATQTECLVVEPSEARISVKVRFLQAIDRTIGAPIVPLAAMPDDPEPHFRAVPALRVGKQLLQSLQEAAEREVLIGPVGIASLKSEPLLQPFAFAAKREYEEVRGPDGELAGLITRNQERIAGTIELFAAQMGAGLFKLTLRVSNGTSMTSDEGHSRERALLHSLLSAHSILRIENGEFVSLLEPPEHLQEFVSSCSNSGTWPVLVGEAGQRDTLLSSPIILYDYPQIAPESAGNLFDGTEIDEILALRILTLTEEEKVEMREGDERAREILERTEALSEEQFAKLHGVIRGMRPASEDQP
jgi:hypothetical protein